ncbi:MAG TPA: transcription antitermination factor NusB, partial [Bacteroidales bacterium]|nr:transcription antitermination factor NusB [Bacteroidales bacterium]
ELLGHALTHYDTYVGYVEKFAENWEPERIAATDIILIVMGIAEAVAFPSIPFKVTLNEMVEISKLYSTGNSRIFVNGILDKILKYLTQEGDIVKTGRGLVEN